MTHTSWTCRCTEVSFALSVGGGTRAVCYCNSCRNFALRLGASDILDEWGGSDLYQVAPEAAQIVRGADKLGWARMTPKGPARWFTTCCHTPLANTLPTPKVPFLTLQSAFIADQDTLGPIEIRLFQKYATGDVPTAKSGQARLLWEFAIRALKSRFSGGWRKNPLFDAAGAPVASQAQLPARRVG